MFYRITLIVVLSVVFNANLYSQIYSGREASEKISNAGKVWLNEKTSEINYVKFSTPISVDEASHTSWLKELLKVPSNYDFYLIRKMDDQIGQTHFRYGQMIDGYPVIGGEYIIHTHYNQIISANGSFLRMGQTPNSPAISESSAFTFAKAHIPSDNYEWVANNETRPQGELVLTSVEGQNYLTYKFDIYSLDPLARAYVFVDSKSGKIVREENRIHETSVNGTAHTKYHGVQTITVDSVSSTSFTLDDNIRSVYTKDLNTTTNYATAISFTDSDNIWNTTTNQDDAALDAHWGAEKTYDYFYNTYGLDSYNGSGASISSYVHYGTNYVNAFWDGTRMTYGDGNGTTYSALTSIDIVAHEISHAVTSYSANLVYSYESGALNESFSDILGVAIDYYANPSTANWYIGDEINITGNGFRNMANPNNMGDPDTYLGTYWYSGAADYGGVHSNSGVQNFWFYLLVNGGSGTNDNSDLYNVPAIGMTDAAAIAYRNLTVYLTSSSQYSDARFYAIQSAFDLFGGCSTQEVATTNAWHAVGLGTSYAGYVISNFEASTTYSCTAPATISFTNNSLNDTARIWFFGDGTTDTSYAPTHTYTNPGNYTVSLITFSGSQCGSLSDTLTMTNYITVLNLGATSAANCTPTATTGNSNYGIFNFSLNTINHSTDGAIDGYQDYSCTQGTFVTEGDVVTLSVGTGLYNANVKVYIDYDTNGTFSSSELVLNSTSSQSHSTTFTIPNITAINTPIRIRVIAGTSVFAITSTCTTNSYQQIEDYAIIIAPVSTPPVADYAANQTSVYFGSNVSFSDLSLNAPTTYAWSFPGGTPSTSTLANPTVTYTTIGSYNVQQIVTNAFGSDTLLIPNYITVTNTLSMCGSTTSTTSISGSLADDGGSGGNYSNNKSCLMLIEPACADSIILNFSQFSLENGYDYVRVYDGTTTSATQILNATGTTLPANVVATSGAMLVQFYSDAYVVSTGFEASWTTVLASANPPVANFSKSTSNPVYGGSVSFTDLTTNSPSSWYWDFDDGTSSSAQNPTHTFNNPGVHHVQLVASVCGYSDTITKNVNVQGAPIIDIQPGSVTRSLGCSETVIVPVKIRNTGAGILNYSIAQSGTGSWSSISSTSGNIAIGDSNTVNITLNSAGLTLGTYNLSYTVTSNDTSATTASIPVTLNMTGTAELSVSTGCLNMGTLNQYVSQSDTFSISNTGCAPMIVSNISSTSNFTVSASTTTLPIGGTAVVTVTYNPTTIGAFNHNITITTNGNDSTICLTGTVGASSVIEITSDSTVGTMRVCDPTVIETMVIKNSGLGSLTWSYVQSGNLPMLNPSNGTIAPGDSAIVSISITNSGIIGVTGQTITINSNAPQLPSITHTVVHNITSEPCADFGYHSISSCDGIIDFEDLSSGITANYTWYFGDGNTSSAAAPRHFYASSGTYSVTQVVCGTTTCDTLIQTLIATINNNVAITSCYPEATNPSTNTGITAVNLNSLSSSTGNSTEGYQDFSCSIGTQIVIDSLTLFSVTTTNVNQRVKAWIDYNNDGAFTSDEIIINSIDFLSFTSIFNSPAGVVLNTPLRLRIRSDIANSTSGSSACANPQDGQVEDYYVIFVEDLLAPTAQYQYTENNDCSGTFSFTDQSQNVPTSWKWYFGDGSSSTLQNPTHQYTAEGVYPVNLISTNSVGSDTITQYVTIEFFNTAFNYLGTTNANQTIEFNQIGSATATTWNWNFGDGNTSTASSPSHVYAQEGEYVVTLTTENQKGCTSTSVDKIQIGQPLGIADAFNESSVQLYPNPNTGNFTLAYEGSGSALHIVISSMNGQTMFIKNMAVNGNTKLQFDNLPLASGMYFIQVDDERELKIVKFIVR